MQAPDTTPASIRDVGLLDNPIWHSLCSVHRDFAQGNELARCYPPDVSPLAGLVTQSGASYAALSEIIQAKTVALFLSSEPQVPTEWTVLHCSEIAQMVCSRKPESMDEMEIVPLGQADVADMLALTDMTKPGPFRPRTHELGTYIGIKRDDRLAAMAGERTHMTGFTELSAVCTHPNYAQKLVTNLARRVFERDETPILHVRQDNDRAIKVYERLGFRIRRLIYLVVLNARSNDKDSGIH